MPTHFQKKLLGRAMGTPILLGLLASLFLSRASAESFTPQPGTSLRQALMDAIRADDFYPTRELARSNPEGIVFKVSFLKVNGGWALANVLPLKTGKEYAEPRWCLLHRTGDQWTVVDYLEKIRKYYKDDVEFWGAIDMNPQAVFYLKREMPMVPKDIFP